MNVQLGTVMDGEPLTFLKKHWAFRRTIVTRQVGDPKRCI
jgi:hypothetical protein